MATYLRESQPDGPRVTGGIAEVAFDESGNTGGNLLDGEQPVFALASVQLSNDEAAALVASLGTKQGELKFSSLRSSGPGRRKILTLLKAEVLSPHPRKDLPHP